MLGASVRGRGRVGPMRGGVCDRAADDGIHDHWSMADQARTRPCRGHGSLFEIRRVHFVVAPSSGDAVADSRPPDPRRRDASRPTVDTRRPQHHHRGVARSLHSGYHHRAGERRRARCSRVRRTSDRSTRHRLRPRPRDRDARRRPGRGSPATRRSPAMASAGPRWATGCCPTIAAAASPRRRSTSLAAVGAANTCRSIESRCYIEPWNDASIRTAERAGFSRDGLLRAWETYADGKPRDMLAFGRIRELSA